MNYENHNKAIQNRNGDRYEPLRYTSRSFDIENQ